MRIEGYLLERLYRRQSAIAQWVAKDKKDRAMVIALIHADGGAFVIDQITDIRCDLGTTQ